MLQRWFLDLSTINIYLIRNEYNHSNAEPVYHLQDDFVPDYTEETN